MRVVATLELTAEIGEFVAAYLPGSARQRVGCPATDLTGRCCDTPQLRGEGNRPPARRIVQSRSPSRQAVTGRRGGHVWPVVLSGLGAITLVVLAAGIALAGLAFHSRRCVSVPRA